MDQASSAAAASTDAVGPPQLAVHQKTRQKGRRALAGHEGDAHADKKQKDNTGEPLVTAQDNTDHTTDHIENSQASQYARSRRKAGTFGNPMLNGMNDLSANISSAISAATSAADNASTAATDNNTLLSGLSEFMRLQQEQATAQSRQQNLLMEQLITVQKEQHVNTQQQQQLAVASSHFAAGGAGAATIPYPALPAPQTPSRMAPPPLAFSPWNGEDSLYHENGETFIPRQIQQGAIVPAQAAGMPAAGSTLATLQAAATPPLQQPVLPTAVPGVRREVTRDTLSDSHIHKLDMEGKTLKNKFWKNVRAQERSLKIDKDIEVLEKDDGGYPPGMRPYKTPLQDTALIADYTLAADDAYNINITIAKGTSRRDTMAQLHRRIALEVKRVEKDAAEDKKTSLAAAVTEAEFAKVIGKVVDPEDNSEIDTPPGVDLAILPPRLLINVPALAKKAEALYAEAVNKFVVEWQAKKS